VASGDRWAKAKPNKDVKKTNMSDFILSSFAEDFEEFCDKIKSLFI